MADGRQRERLTLDTSLFLEYRKEQQRRVVTETLLELARTGEVQRAVTARVREDVPCDPLAKEIDKLSLIGIQETGSVTRLDYWILGRDQLGSDAFVEYENELRERARQTGAKFPTGATSITSTLTSSRSETFS